jgi:subtilase family serine protease
MIARFFAALTVGTMLATTMPAVSAMPARPYLSPAARGVAADVGRVRGVRDLGRLGAAQNVRVGLLMRYRHESELAILTRAQSHKGSPYYRKFLTTAQWNNYFAPDPATYAKTARTMQRAGFRVFQTYPNRAFLVMQAPCAAVERYFNTEIHRVYQQGRGERYANTRPATMPAELRSTVIGVAGLHTTQSYFVTPHPHRNAASDARARANLANVIASVSVRVRAAATASPEPVVVQTPPANPSPDPTESPNNLVVDLTGSLYGIGPPDFAIGYDYPVQHGYGGTGHATGSVIDSDNSDHDMALEFANFDIPNTGSETRVCTTPGGGCQMCDGTATKAGTASLCDAEGESTLDAEALRTLAPDAHFYEYLVNHTTSLIDLNVEAAYETVVNDDVVDAVNSSFGGCETDDPTEEYAVNYIAMEGAAKGITFSASAGDTGALNCGVYITNGAPQTEVNVSSPCAAYYFTCVGGTSYDIPVNAEGVPINGNSYYLAEQAWLDGGGGYSVLEPLPDWQTASVNAQTVATSVSTLGRNTPDVAMAADAGAAFIGGTQGVGLIIFNAGTEEGSGGTSLASPMFVASVASGNQAKGSRGGWINPRLYEIQQNAAGYAAAFNDIDTSANFVYAAVPGYDDATGIGSPKGWELAGEE